MEYCACASDIMHIYLLYKHVSIPMKQFYIARKLIISYKQLVENGDKNVSLTAIYMGQRDRCLFRTRGDGNHTPWMKICTWECGGLTPRWKIKNEKSKEKMRREQKTLNEQKKIIEKIICIIAKSFKDICVKKIVLFTLIILTPDIATGNSRQRISSNNRQNKTRLI